MLFFFSDVEDKKLKSSLSSFTFFPRRSKTAPEGSKHVVSR